MNAVQLKDLMEHSVAASTPTGSPQGRFAQVSGMKVVYDTRNAARTTLGTGSRIRRIVLDDGTVLVDGGVVVDAARTFSFATIDFTANGGDGYPFAANGVVFENNVNTITYQEALANYIKAPKAAGGLQRIDAADGDEITRNLYGVENAFDLHGRLVDLAVGVATPGVTRNGTAGRDTIVGTAGDDIINGGPGADTLTGGAGGDKFVYGSLRDAGDVITDFTPYADTIQLGGLLAGLGCASGSGCDALADGYVRVVDVSGGASLQIDPDGTAGPAAARALVTLKGLTAKQIVPGRDLGL
jgi:Ca2+-binding RTX toxin-like protein